MRETGNIALNGLGNGQVKLGPFQREKWYPNNVHVSVATNTNEAQCTIYVGDSPTQHNFRDQTFSGSSGDSSDKVGSDILITGQFVFAVWNGGDANAQAILTVTGEKEI